MNRALTSDRKYQDHLFPLRKAQYDLLKSALDSAGLPSTRYAILEPSCFPDERKETECRKAEWVEYYLIALSFNVELALLPDINKCNLTEDAQDPPVIPLGSKAILYTNLAGANNDITISAKSRGSLGNILQVQYVDPAGNNQALSVSLVGNLVRVSLATGAGGAITSTASLVMAAINNSETVSEVVEATLTSGNSGAGVVTAMAATNLSGGSDA